MDQRQAIAGVFDRAAETYDQVGVAMFQPIADHLVGELDPLPGERVLDIGCGRGAVLVPLARAVGDSGYALGIDLSPRMVELTHAALTAARLKAEVRLGDAQAPDLPSGSFDLIASSLVLFFLPDPPAALRRWRELLVRGGRVGISTFGDYSESWKPVDAVFTPYLPSPMRDARTSGTAGPFGSDAGMEALLTEAGLAEVRTTSRELDVRFDDEEHWHRWSWSVGQRGMWEFVPEGERSAVRAQAFQRLQGTRDEAGRVGFRQRVRYTFGLRPADR